MKKARVTQIGEDTYRFTETSFGTDVYMYLLIGTEKALLIDTAYGFTDVPAAIRQITDLPLIVVNTHTNNIPDSLIEAAQLDGANDFQVFFRIVLPLAVPVIATISLFTALTYWNDWINGLDYINDASLFGIQNFLMRIMNNIQALKSTAANSSMMINVELPSFSVRMALAVIGMLPVLVLFPFVQKHLIRGVVVGAVKG